MKDLNSLLTGSCFTQWNCLMVGAVSALDESQFAQPQDFVPDRWLQHRPLGQIHPYASLPFSHGTRMCIGIRIMEQILSIFIARVSRNFNLWVRVGNLVTSLLSEHEVIDPSQFCRDSFSE